MNEQLMTVPVFKVDRLRCAISAWQIAMRKWPPAVNETAELRRAVIALLKSARTMEEL